MASCRVSGRAFHYVTLPADAVCALAKMVTETDAFIAEARDSSAVRELLRKGYRWIRTDAGWPVLEKQIIGGLS